MLLCFSLSVGGVYVVFSTRSLRPLKTITLLKIADREKMKEHRSKSEADGRQSGPTASPCGLSPRERGDRTKCEGTERAEQHMQK